LKEAQEQWYTNRDIFEMVQGLKEDMRDLREEMRETKTLIRDYNGLRKKLVEVELRLEQSQGKEQGSKTVWGYIVGVVGILAFLYSLIK